MRTPIDLDAYVRRTRTGPCFICALQRGEPGYEHDVILDDGEHIAFLSRYPTMPGYVLVSPKRHIEHVVRDLDLDAYLRLQTVVHRVARAVESVIAPERTYLLSLGSQQGNSHVHWHIAPLPAGTPYEQQQFHALMTENGVVDQSSGLGANLRAALAA
jgi:diadenosine tetraphosphate (Ap4A) HIT family hydrolase